MYSEIVLDGDGEQVAKAAEPVLGEALHLADAPNLYRRLREASQAAEAERDRDRPHRSGEQLAAAIPAVFGSWNSRRALTYRKPQASPTTLGTAVIVQPMVFGNPAHPRAAASPSPAIRPPATPSCTASSWTAARARRSSRAP